jgi:hypothetical protein
MLEFSRTLGQKDELELTDAELQGIHGGLLHARVGLGEGGHHWGGHHEGGYCGGGYYGGGGCYGSSGFYPVGYGYPYAPVAVAAPTTAVIAEPATAVVAEPVVVGGPVGLGGYYGGCYGGGYGGRC